MFIFEDHSIPLYRCQLFYGKRRRCFSDFVEKQRRLWISDFFLIMEKSDQSVGLFMLEWWNFSCLSILNLTAAGSSFFWISEFQENFWRIELTRCAETRLKMRAVCIQARGHLCSLLTPLDACSESFPPPAELMILCVNATQRRGQRLLSADLSLFQVPAARPASVLEGVFTLFMSSAFTRAGGLPPLEKPPAVSAGL